MASSAPPHPSPPSASASGDGNSPSRAIGSAAEKKDAVAAAEEELSSAVRVRNRLSSSTSDAALPRILTGLLPRVLSRVSKNAARVAELDETLSDFSKEAWTSRRSRGRGREAEDEASTEREVRRKIDAALRGVVRHAEERVLGNTDMDVPWIEAVAEYLSSTFSRDAKSSVDGDGGDNNDENGEERALRLRRERCEFVGRMRSASMALGLLNVALIRTCAATARVEDATTREMRVRAVLAAALRAVESLHRITPASSSSLAGNEGEGGNDGAGDRDEDEEDDHAAAPQPRRRRPARPPRLRPPQPRQRRVGPAPVGLVPDERLGRAARMEAEAVLHEDQIRGMQIRREMEDEEMEDTEAGGFGVGDGADDDGKDDDPRSDAAWLALDCLALLAGIRPLNEAFFGDAPPRDDVVAAESPVSSTPAVTATVWGSDSTDAAVESLVRPEEVAAIVAPSSMPHSPPNDVGAGAGDGFFDLLLDLTLYWPSGGHGTCGGMSPEGVRRMERRFGRRSASSDFGTGDLVELKLAALRYAAWPPGKGLLEDAATASGVVVDDGGGGNTGTSRAITLLLLACGHAPGKKGGTDQGVHRTRMSRVAGGRLARHLDRSRVGKAGVVPVSAVLQSFGISPVEKKKKKKKSSSLGRREGPRLGVGLAYALLILVLGEEAAAPVLAEHRSLEGLWEEVLGRRHRKVLGGGGRGVGDGDGGGDGAASAADYLSASRVPLSARLATAALHFVTDHFFDGKGEAGLSEKEREETTALLVRLALPAAEGALESDTALDGGWLRIAMAHREGRPALQEAGAGVLRAVCDAVSSSSSSSPGTKKKTTVTTTTTTTAASEAAAVDGGGGASPDWRLEARARCLSAARAALSAVPAAADREDDMGVPLHDFEGNPVPLAVRRRFAAHVPAHHREGRGRRRHALLPPVAVRKTAYGVMGVLAPSDGAASSSLALPPLDGPVLLLQCAVAEDGVCAPDVAAALDSYLRVFRSRLLRPTPATTTTKTTATNEDDVLRLSASATAGTRGDEGGGVLQNASTAAMAAAPLLPPLLSAACSESPSARLACARWASDVLSVLDPLAACHLCAHLADDPDPRTARAARECVGAIGGGGGAASSSSFGREPDGKRRKTSKASASAVSAAGAGAASGRVGGGGRRGPNRKEMAPVMFLDSEADMDRQLLRAKLGQEVNDLALRLEVDNSVASVLLRCHDYSCDKALGSYRSDPSGTAERCGVRHRCEKSAFPAASVGVAAVDGCTGHACGICFDDDLDSRDLFSMPCGHSFCRECWRSYLRVEFEEGTSSILDAVCPQEACRERVTDAEVSDLLPSMVDVWMDRRLAAFVERDAGHRYCPGPNCTMIAICDAGLSGGMPMSASCERCRTSFCFGCGEAPHSPSSCEDFRRWNGLFASSEFWVRKNSKPCPRCDVPIEKDHGCNHMHCTRCDCHFCWVCLTVIGADGVLNRHLCNRYDPSQQGGEEGRNMFYVTRFEAHEEAERFARDQLNTMTDNLEELSEEPLLLSDEETCQVKKAAEVLVESRRFLKYSYIVAFCMPDSLAISERSDDDKKLSVHTESERSPSTQNPAKDAFVAHQGTLERFTEKLSALTEVNLENLADQKGERALRMHLRAIDFHTQCVSQYIDRIVSYQDGVEVL